MRRELDPMHLLALSTRFEANAVGRANAASMQDGLSLLSELGAIAASSLPKPAPAAAAPSSAPVTAPKQAIPQAPSVNYESAHPEYKPALKNPSVVDALLNLHRRTRAGSRAEAPLSSFRPQTIPSVEMPTPRKPTHKAR